MHQKINISIEPYRDIDVPVYVHKSDEFYEWSIKRSKYYYNHLIVWFGLACCLMTPGLSKDIQCHV